MESKKNRSKKRVKAHHSSSASDSDSVSEIRKQIEKISMVSGSDYPQQRITRINNDSKKSTPMNNGRIILRQRNLNLYEDDFTKDSQSSLPMTDEFVEDSEIIANIRSVNGGLNYSNKKLERLWGVEKQKAEEVPSLSDPQKYEEWPSLQKDAQIERKKCRKNVAVASLLEQKQEKIKRVNERKIEAELKNHAGRDDLGAKSTDHHFFRDSIDPDFFYRRTTVPNSDADYTVEHIGTVSIVRPRKYHIENFNDEDIAFCRRKRSNGTRNTQGKSSS